SLGNSPAHLRQKFDAAAETDCPPPFLEYNPTRPFPLHQFWAMNSALIERTLRAASFVVVATAAFMLCACAAMTRPAGVGAPGANEPPKFATLAASDERRNAALASWKAIVGEQSATTAPTPELQPVTATLKSLPSNLQTPPRMPLVVINDKSTKTEEETRESLRRFMASSAPLVGVDLS